MKNTYSFIAVLDFAEDGINITFPNIPEAISCADTTEEAIRNAKEVLQLCIESRIKDREKIPVATDINDIETKENQQLLIIKCRV